ncbi:MAG: transketolase-like TK C-terminal-containing protein, partial [Planctomycetota bacterium]
EGILRGMYRYRTSPIEDGPPVQLLASGPILREALEAQEILGEELGVAADVWSVTSFGELRREALEIERWNRLHPDEEPRTPFVAEALDGSEGPVVAATDFMRLVADQIAPWVPGLLSLGTDGFGRSDNRAHLRDFFENDAKAIAAAALAGLARCGRLDGKRAARALRGLGVEPDGPAPWTVD